MIYKTVYILFYAVSLLPYRALYILADVFSFLAYYIIRYRRGVVRRNLSTSFPEKTQREIIAIERGFYRYLGEYFVETVKMLSVSDETLAKHLTFRNVEEIESYFDKGQSCAAMLGHYNNWELLTATGKAYTRHKEAATGLIYHPLRNAVFDRLFIAIRQSKGGVCIPKKDILRHLVTFRRDNRPSLCGYISDQAPKWSNIHLWLPFLNHDTPVFTGGERIMRKMNNAVFYADMERISRGRYVCTFRLITDRPAELPEFEVTRRFFQMLEETVRRDPTRYLWSHDRWKRTHEEFDRRFHVENGHVIRTTTNPLSLRLRTAPSATLKAHHQRHKSSTMKAPYIRKSAIGSDFQQMETFVRRLPEVFDTEGEELYRKRNVVKKLDADGTPVVVKRFRRSSPLQRFVYSYIRKSKAARAFIYAQEMQSRGISTPSGIAYVETWQGGMLLDSYFVAAVCPLPDLEDKLQGTDFDRDCADALARHIVTLHTKGILHGDLNLSNILYQCGTDGQYRFTLIDTNRAKFCRPTRRQCLRDMMRLTHNRTLLDYVTRRYAAARGWDEDGSVAEVTAILDSFERRKRLTRGLKKVFRRNRQAK